MGRPSGEEPHRYSGPSEIVQNCLTADKETVIRNGSVFRFCPVDTMDRECPGVRFKNCAAISKEVNKRFFDNF